MSVTVLLRMQIRDDDLDACWRAARVDLGVTRTHEGCEAVTTHFNPDTREVLLVERWTRREDQERYAAWRSEPGNGGDFGSFRDGPASVEYFEDIAT